MTIETDRAIARKMNKLRMFDIAQSVVAAARAVIASEKHQGPIANYEWLAEASDEWEDYVDATKRELGIHVEG